MRLAIGHAHYDHTGGLPALLERVASRYRRSMPTRIFFESDSRSEEGEPRSRGLALTREELAARLTLNLEAVPQEIIPGVWTTGEITQRPEPEGRSAHHLVRKGDVFVADSYRDDMALVLEMDGRLVLLCGCCHAGLLNTLAHVQRTFERPIAAIAGGLHLTSAAGEHLQHVGDVLVEMESVQRVYPNHCTGEAPFVALTLTWGRLLCVPAPWGLNLTWRCTL